jgi:urease
MFAALVPQMSVVFVSQASIDSGAVASYGLRKRVAPVKYCRDIGKRDMKFNDAMPRMRVDPETYVVEADGVVCDAEPILELPMAQSRFMY